jgi:hypothetical protein
MDKKTGGIIAIPIIVGVLTLRNKPAKPASFNEPPPPVS